MKDFIPHPYQEAGTHFALNHDRGMLAVDLGLGKSIMMLNAIDAYVRAGEDRPSLIIAPLRVARSTWKKEAAKWRHLSHLEVVPIVGTQQERLAALKRDAPIFTVNYENLPWLVEQWKDRWPYRTMVADESTKLKSHRSHFRKGNLVCTGGTRASAIARLAFKKTKRMWLLTGTPCANSLLDLWGQYWFIDGGERLGKSFSAFQDRWFKVGFNGFSIEPLPFAEGQIREAIKDVTFTLRAEDYLDLGEEITNDMYVDLPPRAMSLYREMEKDLYTRIQAGEVEAFNAATKTIKNHQMANGSIYYDKEGNWEELHDAKIEALQSIVEEANGMPIIVVYKFKSDLARLKKAFPKGKAFDTSAQTEYDFHQGKIPQLFLHPDNAGHGVDGLQDVTNQICLFSLDWNNELRQQVIGRIGRVRQWQSGFDRPVMVHRIIARNTIDEDILDRIRNKTSVEEALKKGLARRGLK